MSSPTRVVAIGPTMPGWGSWDWIGSFLFEHLRPQFQTVAFAPWEVPDADAVVVVKHAPPSEWAERVAERAALVYCPIDHYGDVDEIRADAPWLRLCARVLVHCKRLEPYFAPFAPTAYVDHPIKFVAPVQPVDRSDGPLLWVGARSNLPPLVAWVNAHTLPAPLDVLTNPAVPGQVPSPADLGFTRTNEVRVHEWTPERHLQFAGAARAALDIKGDDFRSRHKPPAKALDFVASGLPLAMNADSSSVEHLAALGLTAPCPDDAETWLSERYRQETRQLGERLLRELAPERVVAGYRAAITEALAERPHLAHAQPPEPAAARSVSDREAAYHAAHASALRGEHAVARVELAVLDTDDTPNALRALVRNDRAALAALTGMLEEAGAGFRSALALDPGCEPARANLDALGAVLPPARIGRRTRVAVLSLLFNWPSTGGGNVHTAELTRFLAEAGYEVRHLYARFDPWGLGRVTEPPPHPAEAVEFGDGDWTADRIVGRFRSAVETFDPDWVVLTDSWNMKPLLAGAAGARPYVLRLQALECLCPLNNVRLLPGADGPRQCARHQLATPDACSRCIVELEHTSGELHRAERELAGVGTPRYREALRAGFAGASAVLVVDPLAAVMVGPHAADVRVVTSGMDPARFPWPFPAAHKRLPPPGRLRVLFAGLTHEWTKGFHVLQIAADRLWAERQDFEVVVTDAPPADRPAEPWARYVGWQSQAELPGYLAGADVVVVPAPAQEALGRVAVEAMGAGRPVVASRIGGLPFTVLDGATGLLCAPGDPDDLAAKLAALLDNGPLRERLGAAGRVRFEEHYAWPSLVARHYVPLFGPPVRVPEAGRATGAGSDRSGTAKRSGA